ncbi:MAG TPA: hypothetical protein VHD56_17755 [Tepidisphaeraceae bacterium]|nr:hypothetical protein [Tepidisphaeraceae bacterium]
MDEQPVQLLKETRTPILATREHGKRVDYEYERAGTANIFMFTEPLVGWRQVSVRATKTKADWAVEKAGLLEGRYAACPKVNPIAVWEVKEHYHTTTFGSRVSGAIYETLLDGMELDELRENEGVDVKHYLMVNTYKTWWEDGRSYICRIIDMLHVGLLIG